MTMDRKRLAELEKASEHETLARLLRNGWTQDGQSWLGLATIAENFLRSAAEADLTAMREENERLEKAMRYQEARSDRIGTHGVGCETWGPQHYECALRELEAARQALGTSHGS